jgi:hypothetical protein
MCCDAISLITVSIEKVLITKYEVPEGALLLVEGGCAEYLGVAFISQPHPRPLSRGEGRAFSLRVGF